MVAIVDDAAIELTCESGRLYWRPWPHDGKRQWDGPWRTEERVVDRVRAWIRKRLEICAH